MHSNKKGVCVLVGIEPDVAVRLHSALVSLGWTPRYGSNLEGGDVVFCDIRSRAWRATLKAAAAQPRAVPVIAVDRHPNEEAWLNALEAGAVDYLCAGFEYIELQWVLDSRQKAPAMAPASEESRPLLAATA